MRYKKISLWCLLLSITVHSTVSAALPNEKKTVKQFEQKSIVTEVDSKAKHTERLFYKKADKTVVSNKPKSSAKINAENVKTTVKPSLLQEREGKFYFSDTELPDNYRSISIFGEPTATKSQAVAYIKMNNPLVRLSCSVEELVALYWEEALRENVRPDLALAQSLVETGVYRYGGDVQHHQNNFCGLGTTGGGVRGAAFATPKLGVRAHIQHLLAYTQAKRPSTEIVDPRYELAHNIRLERGVVDTWYGLNGTWAMGSLYCEKIMATYQKILAQQVQEKIKITEIEQEDIKKEKKKKKRSMKQRVKDILQKEK